MTMSDEWMKLIKGKRFKGQTEHKYKCSDGYHKLGYKGYYQYPKEVAPKKIYCKFTNYYPVFGYEKIYGPGGLEKSKNLELSEDSLDNFSSIPTVVWDQFKFTSNHFPSSQSEKDGQVFLKKVWKEIEEIIPSIIGEGYCISHEEVLELDAMDRNHIDDGTSISKSDI